MSRWIDVAKSASALADAVSPAPVAGLSVDLLIAISGAQDAQTALLSSIDRNVALIRTGPFRAAQEHLSSARDYGPEHSEYQHELRAARFSFVAALGQICSGTRPNRLPGGAVIYPLPSRPSRVAPRGH